MNAHAILAKLKAAGVSVSRQGNNLLAKPKAAVTDGLLALMREHKGELLAALSEPPPGVQQAAPEQRSVAGAGITNAEELRALVNTVADFHGFRDDRRSEAQQIAQADAEAALECFRELAGGLPCNQASRLPCNQLPEDNRPGLSGSSIQVLH